jgi:hypothetical protein
MLKIETDKLKILSDFQTEEKVYPYREGKTRVYGYRILCDDKIILIGTYYTDGQPAGRYGAFVFFQRKNLKQVSQAIEDWLDDEKSTGKENIEIIEGEDDFLVSFGFPDRFDVRPVLMLTTFREAEINGYSQRAWDLVTAPETGHKLIEELKQILKQQETQRLIAG